MLLQFTVENFLSFDEPTHFTMRASKDKDHPDHLIKAGKWTAVKGTALYGANSAGKSNIVLAMGFARDFIVKERGVNLSYVRPFRAKDNEHKPSGFHWQFIHNGKLWSYGFDVTQKEVIEEYLFARDENGGRERKWFERKTNEQGTVSIVFGDEFLEGMTTDDVQFLKLKAPRVDADRLFLRECLEEKIAAVKPIFDWFQNVLLILRAETKYAPLVWEANDDSSFLDFLSQHVRDAGTGISCLDTAGADFEVEKFIEDFSLGALSPDEFVRKIKSGETVVLRDMEREGEVVVRLMPTGKVRGQIIFTQHLLKGDEVVFDLWEESEGTQRFIHLLPHLYRLQTRPTVLIIDEIERRLHTLLTWRFIDQALNVSPIERSQFIFTTHDTNLLDSELLRRDEVWFVDKNENGSSSLKSLAEFKIRSDANYEKGYLLGAFDGIPYFRNTGRLSEALKKKEAQ